MKMFRPLGLLLKYEGYPPAVVVAVLLHGTLLYFMLDRGIGPEEQVNVERPTYIAASVIQENPQRLRRVEQLEQQRREQAAREEAEQRAREQEAARQRAEQQAREQAEQERQAAEQAEAERRQRELAQQRREEEAARQAREEAQRRERERQQQLAREQQAAEAARRAEAQRAAEQAAAEDRMEQAYSAIIHDTVSRNWRIPPTARNGMQVLLQIDMVPTGEVVAVNVLSSSGDAAFDRSAVQAVEKADRFPEVQDMPIGLFERQFRRFRLLFSPEDLLRDQ